MAAQPACAVAALAFSKLASAGSGAAIEGRSALLSFGASSQRLSGGIAVSGVDAIVQVPAARWHIPHMLPEPVASRVQHGGFVSGAEVVDNAAFAVSPTEVAAMDPSQRLLLEHGYAALHDGAIGRAALCGSLTGVFLGFAGSEFSQVAAATPLGSSVYVATGSSAPVACGRLSFVLGLHGPCVLYDTACSAALVACHAGLRALQLNECGSRCPGPKSRCSLLSSKAAYKPNVFASQPCGCA